MESAKIHALEFLHVQQMQSVSLKMSSLSESWYALANLDTLERETSSVISLVSYYFIDAYALVFLHFKQLLQRHQ